MNSNCPITKTTPKHQYSASRRNTTLVQGTLYASLTKIFQFFNTRNHTNNNRVATKPVLRLCDLPIEILLEIADYLTWSELASWSRLDHQHNQRVSPLLYRRLKPFCESIPQYLPKDLKSGDKINSRNLILNWAAQRGISGTIERISGIEPIGECINIPTLRSGYGTSYGSFGMTPMHLAALHGQAEMIDYLVEQGANVDVPIAGGLRPIHFARNNNVVRAIVRHGGSTTSRGDSQLAPLTYVLSTNPELSAVKCMLELGADPNLATLGGSSAATEAIRRGNINALELFLESGLDLSKPSIKRGFLMYQVFHHLNSQPFLATRAARELLKYGASPDVLIDTHSYRRAYPRQTPLYLAVAMKGSLEAVELLLEHGAETEAMSWAVTQPRPTAHIEGQDWHVKLETPMIRLLLDPALPRTNDEIEKRLEIANLLVKHGARVDQPYNGETLLLSLLQQQRAASSEIVQFVLDHRPDLLAPGMTIHGYELPIHKLIRNNSWFSIGMARSVGYKALKRLLSLDANVDARDSQGKTPLILACEPGNTLPGLVIKLLLQYRADANAIDDLGGTPLRSIVGRPYTSLNFMRATSLRALLAHSAVGCIDLNTPGPDGLTPLMVLATQRVVDWPPDKRDDDIEARERMINLLVRHGADIHMQSLGDQPRGLVGAGVLHYACESFEPFLLNHLLYKGAKENINDKTRSGLTPLMVLINATAEGSLNRGQMCGMKQILLEAGADISLRNSEGQTAWDIWTDKGHVDAAWMCSLEDIKTS
jgi:ankyrin repeat protein